MSSIRNIKGKLYRLVILRITAWDEAGRPKEAVVGYDDTTFDLREGSTEFMTAFIPVDMAKGQRRDN